MFSDTYLALRAIPHLYLRRSGSDEPTVEYSRGADQYNHARNSGPRPADLKLRMPESEMIEWLAAQPHSLQVFDEQRYYQVGASTVASDISWLKVPNTLHKIDLFFGRSALLDAVLESTRRRNNPVTRRAALFEALAASGHEALQKVHGRRAEIMTRLKGRDEPGALAWLNLGVFGYSVDAVPWSDNLLLTFKHSREDTYLTLASVARLHDLTAAILEGLRMRSIPVLSP